MVVMVDGRANCIKSIILFDIGSCFAYYQTELYIFSPDEVSIVRSIVKTALKNSIYFRSQNQIFAVETIKQQ